MKRILIALLMLFPALMEGQTPNFALNDASTYSAERVYLNIGADNYYNTYLSKNKIKVNPAMQPQLVRQVEHCSSGSTTSCITGAQYGDYSGVPANYYAGWTVYVACHGGQGASPGTCSGGAQGQTTTATSNTADTGSSTTINFNALTASIGAFDTIWLLKPSTITTPSAQFTWPDFGWQPSTTGSGTATIDTTSADFPPTLDGFANVVQVVEMTAPTSSSTSQILTYYDTGTGPNDLFNGSYHHCVNVKVKSGSGTLTFAGTRPSGVSWSQTVSVSSSSWTNACATFTGSETTSTPSGSVTITMTLSTTASADIVVYGASLTADADTNPTNFTNKTISNIQLLNPGGLRFNDSGTVMGQSVLNWITPGPMRAMSSYVGSYDGAAGQGLSLHEFLALCQYLNIVPVITAPVTWSATDWQNFVQYLGGSSSTTYGAYRAALGQSAAWTSVFSKIIVEIDNEPWNDTLGLGKFAFPLYTASATSYWNYPTPAVNACGAIKTSPSYSSVIKCGVGVQTANSSTTGYFTTIDTNHYVDRVNANWYGLFGPTTCTNPALWTSSWVEALNTTTSNDDLGINATQTSKGSWMSIFGYEGANSTNSGSCTQANLTGFPEGEGYGITNALMPRVMQKAGYGTEQAIWQMYQPTTGITTSAGTFNINEWGVFTGPGGVYNNLRAMGYGVKLANDCVSTGNTGYAVTPSNITTFNFSASNGVNATSNVPTLNSFAFSTGSNRCLLVENIDPTNSYNFTVSGTNSPSGSITRNLFTGSALTASNEGANTTPNVTITSSTISPGTYTIPAASAVALIWSTSTNHTWFIRTDGSNPTNCTGLTNAAYPGSGTGQACGFSHPFWLLNQSTFAWNIAAGDTVQFNDLGPYYMGQTLSGVGSSWPFCVGNAVNCVMPALPNNVHFLGKNAGACSNPLTSGTVLSGINGAFEILNLQASASPDIECFHLTQPDTCTRAGTGTGQCVSGTNNYASHGIRFEYQVAQGPSNFTLKDMLIEGLSGQGILGSKVNLLGADTSTAQNVSVIGNGLAGWDSDGGGCGTSCESVGNINLGASGVLGVDVEWNGCVTVKPFTATSFFPLTGATNGFNYCYDDANAGYGDGFSFIANNANLTVTNSFFYYNTQDGLDDLHASDDITKTPSVTLSNSKSIGNEGATFKLGAGNLAKAFNNYSSGNCRVLATASNFPSNPTGWNTGLGDFCRASGDQWSLQINNGSTVQMYFNTSTGYGATMYDISCASGGTCTTGTTFLFRNNLSLGFVDPSTSNLPGGINIGTSGNPFANTGSSITNNLWFNMRSGTCPQQPSYETAYQCSDPLLVSESNVNAINPNLTSSSPANANGVTISGITTDYNGNARTSPPAIGAFQLIGGGGTTLGGGITLSGGVIIH